MPSLDSLSPTAWIVANNLINENQQPIEFKNHRFLIEPFDDMHHDIVSRKSAQVGFSVLAILKSAWLAKYKGINTIYVLPTQDIVKSFVNPKVDPLIASNPAIKDMVSKDSVTLKQVGNRFIHYKGSSSQREAISTSADLLVIDEYDRCLDMNVLNTYDSRLQASEWGWRWRFSNPSAVGFGVDSLYTDSDQRHWFVQCSHCNHRWFIDFERDDSTKQHYVDQKKQIYACGACHKEISDTDRRNGEWIAKYPSRDRHGYWFAQMMAPWVSAKRILEQREESSIDFFNNFVLGKAYTPSDMIVNRETILRANVPSQIPRINVAIGVDQNVSEQIWVAATPQGVFAHGKAKSWEEIEHLKLMYNAVVVCDPNPYSTMPKQMAKKYPDWYMCYFKQMDGLNILQWKDSVVYADRTRLLDLVATEIAEAKFLFREHPYALEDYIKDWSNIYRTTVEKEDGKIKSEWLKKEGQLSDYSFATCLVGETLIATDKGEMRIDLVKRGDRVLTRDGYKVVSDAGYTGTKPVVRAEFSNGSTIMGTADHRVFTHNRGFVALADLTTDDILEVCKSKTGYRKNTSRSTVEDIIVTPTLRNVIIGYTIAPLAYLKRCCIAIYGNIKTVAYLKDMRFTTSTTIPLTTPWTIFSAYPRVTISSSTQSSGSLRQSKGRDEAHRYILRRPTPNQQSGGAQQDSTTTRRSGEAYSRSRNILVRLVGRIIKPRTGVIMPIARQFATRNSGVKLIRVTPTNTERSVYNLSVDGKPEYYANGILVHNCYARIGLGKVMGGVSQFIEPEYQVSNAPVTDTVFEGGRLKTSLGDMVEETFKEM